MSLESIDRLQRIRAVLDSTGRARVAELAENLGVSEMTVRRDLGLLEDKGLAQRVRGGAVAKGPQPFADRFGKNARAKERIADKLAALVGEGGAIGIDASSTMERLAARLAPADDLTVLTNSPESFAALSGRTGITALLTGGQLDPRSGSLVGPLATRAARDVILRSVFLSAAGIDADLGTTETTLEDAEVKLALADVSGQIVVAVDSSKLGQRATARCLPVDRIDILVTELDPDHPALEPFRDRCEVV